MNDNDASTKLRLEMGQRLRKIRNINQLTQEQMAVLIGITSAYYGKIERGEHSLTSERLFNLHKKLKIDINYLITGEESNDNTINELLKRCTNDENRADLEIIFKHILKIANQ